MARTGERSRIPRLSTSLRKSEGARSLSLSQQKASSLDDIPMDGTEEPFAPPFRATKHRRGLSSPIDGDPTLGSPPHRKKRSSGEISISRSHGHKYGLSLPLSPGPSPLIHMPDFSTSNSSLSSVSTTNDIPSTTTSLSPIRPSIFEDTKPNLDVFSVTKPGTKHKQRYIPRDSGFGGAIADEDRSKMHPPSVLRAKAGARRSVLYKRRSSVGTGSIMDVERLLEAETSNLEVELSPVASSSTVWPGPPILFASDGKPLSSGRGDHTYMKSGIPETPVKKPVFAHSGHIIGQSSSQPTLGENVLGRASTGLISKRNLPLTRSERSIQPPPTVRKPVPLKYTPPSIPKLNLSLSSPESGMDTDEQSPTVGAFGSPSGNVLGTPSRVTFLRYHSGNSSEEGTPTKVKRASFLARSSRTVAHPPSPKATENVSIGLNRKDIVPRPPRLSLPAIPPPKAHRTLHHRQSHPIRGPVQQQEDIFEKRFITLATLGSGAFSTVLKVRERDGDGVYAVKKARGVFDGVRDRLRHLEEVDILRHLSQSPCPHVVQFVDAWEQNRQLYIQTELCLGSLAFFLDEYGRVIERIDEGRCWKIVRELSDGLNHIHSSGVIHFDLKPANILISDAGSLKIADFGMATRWPRIKPDAIIRGSGLGGSTVYGGQEEVEREGDRRYMAPEMLRGVFVMAADIFSFGLIILEVATNIEMPDGGDPWIAFRENDLSLVDLSVLSPALSELIVKCMNSDPSNRPAISNIVSHPIVQRATGNGRTALAPEEPRWLTDVLAGYTSQFFADADGDITMAD